MQLIAAGIAPVGLSNPERHDNKGKGSGVCNAEHRGSTQRVPLPPVPALLNQVARDSPESALTLRKRFEKAEK